jgi:HEPN domain-containing protein
MSNGDDQVQSEAKLHTIAGDQALMVLHWLTWADNDYLAARKLLLDGLLVQGASLANTSIEKYLKALLVFQNKNVVRGHNPLAIYEEVKKGSTLQLDKTFLGLLKKSYEMRYPDDLEEGYNIVLSQALLLHGLDQSVKAITDRIVIKKNSGETAKRKLDLLIEQRSSHLFSMNTALGTITKDALLTQPSLVFECRFLYGNYLGAEYVTDQIEDASFERVGFIQKSEKDFQLAYTPKQS